MAGTIRTVLLAVLLVVAPIVIASQSTPAPKPTLTRADYAKFTSDDSFPKDMRADYQQRQLDWFAYYLKGEPAADWILNGESYLARKKILDQANPPSGTRGATAARGGRGGGR